MVNSYSVLHNIFLTLVNSNENENGLSSGGVCLRFYRVFVAFFAGLLAARENDEGDRENTKEKEK